MRRLTGRVPNGRSKASTAAISGWRPFGTSSGRRSRLVDLELHDFRQRGPYVLASNTAHMRGRDGIEVTARSTFVFTIENGLITRQQMFQERADALEAVGLPE